MAENRQGGNVYERVCEIFKIPCLYPEQINAIEAILNKKSVYASLPTGYGKSMIYYYDFVALHSMWIIFLKG